MLAVIKFGKYRLWEVWQKNFGELKSICSLIEYPMLLNTNQRIIMHGTVLTHGQYNRKPKCHT